MAAGVVEEGGGGFRSPSTGDGFGGGSNSHGEKMVVGTGKRREQRWVVRSFRNSNF